MIPQQPGLDIQPASRDSGEDARQPAGPRVRRILDFALTGAPANTDAGAAERNPHGIPPVGKAFGDYILLDEIGRGGTGVVYCAWQPRLQRKVALKMLSAVRIETPDARDRFKREAELTASLDHPNILPIHEVGEQEGTPYYTSKLAVGGCLSSRIDHYRGHFAEIAQLVATLARAVGHAHGHGVLHRDIKPSNVVFDGNDLCMVADFGLARRLEADSSLTGVGTLIGTPRYVAPEVVSTTSEKLTVAVDVYGLGAVLYELLTGAPPFSELTSLQLLREVCTRRPIPPHKFDPAIPAQLETICLRCLEKRPNDRFASAAALTEALEAWLRATPMRASPISAWLQGLLPSRRRTWAWRLGLLAIVSVTAATWIMVQRGVIPLTPNLANATRHVTVVPAHRSRTPAAEAAAVQAFAAALREDRVATTIPAEPDRGANGPPGSALGRGMRMGAFVQVQVALSGQASDSTVRARAVDLLRGQRIWQGQAQQNEIGSLARQFANALAVHRANVRESAVPHAAVAAVARGDELYGRFEKDANDAAIEAYQQAIAIAPTLALAHARLSAAYAQRSNRFGSAAFWNDSAIESAERAIRLDPTLPPASSALGYAYYNKGWWQRSVAAYERAKALGGLGIESELALIYYGTGRYDEAFQLYTQDLQFAPPHGGIHYFAAQTLFTLGATDLGEHWMRVAIASEPHAGKRQLMEAEIARYRGDYARCRKLAAALDKDLVSGGFGTAGDIARGCAERQHDWPAALALLEHEKRLYASGIGDLGNAGPALEEAILLEQLGRHLQAEPVLAAARQSAQAGIDSGREYPKIWLRMATVLRMTGDIEGAYRMLDIAFAHGLTINARNAGDPEFMPFLGDARFVRLREASEAALDAMRGKVEDMLRTEDFGADKTATD